MFPRTDNHILLQISRDRSRFSIISDGRYFCGRLIRVSINSVQHTMASANGSVSTGEFSYRLDELKTRLRNGLEIKGINPGRVPKATVGGVG